MSIATLTLYAYYEKCGASDEDAKLIGSLFGEDYLNRQTSARLMGLGNLAKASAAQGISDGVLSSAAGDSRFPPPAKLKDRDDILMAIRIVRAAGLCSVAVGGYALHKDQSEEYTSQFDCFMDCNKMRSVPFSSYADHDTEKMRFADSSARLAIESMALGKRKGLLSGLLG